MNRLDERVFKVVPKPMLTGFILDWRVVRIYRVLGNFSKLMSNYLIRIPVLLGWRLNKADVTGLLLNGVKQSLT